MRVPFRNKTLESIEESDLQELIENGVLEGKFLEYKKSLPGETDSEKKEFLADVSSFANAAGGQLILGIRESDNVPTEVCGTEVSTPDKEIQRLENMVRDGIDPRLPGVSMRHLNLQNSRTAFIMRIPRSFASPHMVTLRGHSKFYSRNSIGKYPLDVDELRAAFVLSEATADRIRNFRIERLGRIIAGETPVPMDDVAKIVLHVIPLGAFDPSANLDLSAMERELRGVAPMSGEGGWDHRYNFDGFMNFAQFPRSSSVHSYIQFFRNGIVEATDAYLLGDAENTQRIPSMTFEKNLFKALRNVFDVQSQAGISPPVLVMLSLLAVRGYTMGVVDSGEPLHSRPIDRDSLVIPEVLVEQFGDDTARVLRPAFDAVWNATGWPGSIHYDESGNWVRPQ